MTPQKAVGLWIRVSSEGQVKDESPEHHEKRGRLYAEAKGWNIVEVYRLEAISGKSVMDQPETKRMLKDMKSGRINGLIFSKLARLARNTKELLEFADIFKAHNADLISLAESIDTSTPAGRLFYTMIAAMATWEREEIAERVAASVPIRAKMGKPLSGSTSFGYKWVNKEFVIDEKEAPIRKLMYELFLKTRRKKATARALNEMGYRTRNGSKFTYTTVTRLLRDTTAKGIRKANFTTSKGVLKPQADWVVTSCPAIVSEDVWNDVNKILDEQLENTAKPAPRVIHLLSGYITCSCGKKMYVYHKDKSPTYRCKECGTKIEVGDIDEIFHAQLKSFLLTDTEVSDYLKKSDSDLQEKQQLLDITKAEIDNIRKQLKDLIDLRLKGELSTETLAPLLKPLEHRVAQLESKLPDLEAEVDFLKIQYLSSETVLESAKDLYNNWPTLPFEEKRSIVEMITDKITIGKSDINICLSYLPSPRTPQLSQNSGKGQHVTPSMVRVLLSELNMRRILFHLSMWA